MILYIDLDVVNIWIAALNIVCAASLIVIPLIRRRKNGLNDSVQQSMWCCKLCGDVCCEHCGGCCEYCGDVCCEHCGGCCEYC